MKKFTILYKSRRSDRNETAVIEAPSESEARASLRLQEGEDVAILCCWMSYKPARRNG